MHEVLVNRLGGLSLPRKSVVRLIDRPDMTLDVYRGRKTTMQQQEGFRKSYFSIVWVSGCISFIIREEHGIHCATETMKLPTVVFSTLTE